MSSGALFSSNSIFADGPQRKAQRAAGATLGSIAVHGLLILFVGFLVARDQLAPEAPPVELPPSTLVFLQQPGPGGGGGGSPAPAPPKPIEIPKTKPPAPIPIAPPPPRVTPPPPPTLTAPVMTANATTPQATGANLSAPPAPAGGGGAGTGLGTGRGRGVGEGRDSGFGGGVPRGGAGITNPVLLRESKPLYTGDAMRAKIQGTVTLEAVVNPDGSVGDVRVIRSLDRTHGLDLEAIKAAKLWFFRPATDRTGKPVAIVVTLEIGFALH